MAREHFPGAIEIVDLFHAKERLWDLSNTLYRGDAERVEAWAEARCGELDAGSMHALLQHLCESTPRIATRRASAADISVAIANACATRNSVRKACVSARAWWRPAARRW